MPPEIAWLIAGLLLLTVVVLMVYISGLHAELTAAEARQDTWYELEMSRGVGRGRNAE